VNEKESTMRGTSVTYLLLGALLATLGLPVAASLNLPHTFAPGTPIRSADVNANFDALAEGIDALEAGKQNAITGTPCGAGQFVRAIASDGALECGVDQLGSAGAAGVASLNGLTGSLAIQAGANVTVETSEDGRITVSAEGGGGGGPMLVAHDESLEGDGTQQSPLGVADGGVTAAMLATDAEPAAPSQVLTWNGTGLSWQLQPGGGGLALPYSGRADSGDAAFAITNDSATALSGATANGNGVFGLSSAGGNGVSGYSETGYGVIGTSNTGVSGVYGESKISGGAGVRGVNSAGAGSSGVWGESAAGSGVRGSSSSGTGVHGASQQGYGVRGTVSASGTGVYGENTSSSAGAGVQGRADHASSVGVAGTSTAGTGVRGTSQSGYGLHGSTQSGAAGVYGTNGRVGGAGVLGSDGANDSIAVRGNASSNGSVGIWGQATNATGVYGQSNSGVGVWGRSTSGPAMRAEGHAVQSANAGGWAKAMVYVNHRANPALQRCFNSQQAGALVDGGGCGISVTRVGAGQWRVSFGFDISMRFFIASVEEVGGRMTINVFPLNATTLEVSMWDRSNDRTEDRPFHLVVF
jgi:hypothetical protein